MSSLFSRLKRKPVGDPIQAAIGDFELPSFPAVTMRALEAARNPEVTTSTIADIVATDPGLTTRLLNTVNSAAFALRHEVRSVHHAISMLGRNQLESILIAVAVGGALPGSPAPGFEATRFWRTAAQRAALASSLADRLDPARKSESFTAALLQDMALPLLAHHRGEDYGPLLLQWHNGQEDLVQLEREAFDWDHAVIGEAMCARWKFPAGLAEAIAGHHEDEIGIPAVDLVAVLREVDVEYGLDQLVERAKSTFGLSEDETSKLVHESFETANGMARLFSG